MQDVVRGARGALACGHPLGVSAGLEAFRRGGGAVDAAVSAAAALAVALPDACGLGGDAMLLVRDPDGGITAYNGSGAAPARQGAEVPPLDHGSAAAVPGAVDAWCEAHSRAGRLPLAELLAPAARLADEGFPAGLGTISAFNAHAARLAPIEDWELLSGAEIRLGEILRSPRLASLIGEIAERGPSAIYRGPMAAAIASAVERTGGVLAPSDLDNHRTIRRDPISCRFPTGRVWVQPPISQALLSVIVLRSLARHRPIARRDRTHMAVEAVEAAFAHRDRVAEAESEKRLLEIDLDIDPVRAQRRGGPRAYAHTTAVTAADADGTVVSQLVSLFNPFGSAIVVPEGGFLLNDRLTGFSPEPASPNRPRPGGRPVHTLSPAMVECDDRVVALASPGADGQVQFLVQLIDGLLTEDRALPHLLERPRWRSSEGRLFFEAGYDVEDIVALEAKGHDCVERPGGDPLFGAAVASGLDLREGSVLAAGDRRLDTAAGAI